MGNYMKYAIDKIENNIIVLENLNTKEITNINKNLLSFKVKEGDILVYQNNKYYLDNNEKEKRIKIIKEKFLKVKKGH